MDAKALVAIADYLRLIHENLIWPLLKGSKRVPGKPDLLWAVNKVLLRLNAQASAMGGRLCKSNDECEQNEECVGGICVPIPPFDLEFSPATKPLAPLGDDVRMAIEAYFASIHEALSAALAADPRRLGDIRDVLMGAYAAAYRLTGQPLKPCQDSSACGENKECVNGVCVPIPFKLRYRAVGTPPAPPWT